MRRKPRLIGLLPAPLPKHFPKGCVDNAVC
jgi:hypothetical protein